jgi:hypothetical protein
MAGAKSRVRNGVEILEMEMEKKQKKQRRESYPACKGGS